MFDFTSVQRCLNHILTGCPPYCLCTNRNRSEEKLKADWRNKWPVWAELNLTWAA